MCTPKSYDRNGSFDNTNEEAMNCRLISVYSQPSLPYTTSCMCILNYKIYPCIGYRPGARPCHARALPARDPHVQVPRQGTVVLGGHERQTGARGRRGTDGAESAQSSARRRRQGRRPNHSHVVGAPAFALAHAYKLVSSLHLFALSLLLMSILTRVLNESFTHKFSFHS